MGTRGGDSEINEGAVAECFVQCKKIQFSEVESLAM